MKKKLLYILDHLEEYLAGGLLLAMAAVAFINVVSRFTFKFSISYIEELEIYLYVWLVLLGSAIAFKKWKHLCVSIFVERLPEKVQRIIEYIVSGLTIAFFIILFIYSIRQIQDEILLGVTTTSMGVPMWWYTLGLPIGGAFVIIRLIQRVVTGSKKPEEIEEPPLKGGMTSDR